MTKRKRVLATYILGNFIPLLQLAALPLIWMLLPTSLTKCLGSFVWLLFVPPFLTRIIYYFFKKPNGLFVEDSVEFRVWFLTSQLQVLFMRFHFIEEIMRCIPTLYNFWLRCWGSKIGSLVYWSPQSFVMDRSFLQIGNNVVIGAGVGLSAHFVNRQGDRVELLIAAIEIQDQASLGGQSMLGPGSIVTKGENLPATSKLAPYYSWSGGRRHSPKASWSGASAE